MRVLLQEKGSFSGCPDVISAPVVHLQQFRQSDATRKRFKAFAHLSLGTVFSLAELDLSSSVSADVHHHFSDEIDRRAEARQRRKAEEERAARAEASRCEKERRKHGKSASLDTWRRQGIAVGGKKEGVSTSSIPLRSLAWSCGTVRVGAR